MNTDDSQIHRGHRARMRNKLKKHGTSVFDTYELLEMLLYNGVLYKDTNPISKRLLAQFGSASAVLNATSDELSGLDGFGEGMLDFFTRVRSFTEIIGLELPCTEKTLKTLNDIGSFFILYCYGSNVSRVAALYFDNDMRPLHVETLDDKYFDHNEDVIDPTPIIDTALRLHASSVATAYAGRWIGSGIDTRIGSMQNRISNLLTEVGIGYVEHFVVDSYSYVGSFGKTSGTDTEIVESGIRYEHFLSPCRTRYFDEVSSRLSAILAVANRRIDAKAAADKLLTRYSTAENLFMADYADLEETVGDSGASLLKVFGALFARDTVEAFKSGKRYSTDEINEFLKAYYLADSEEKLSLLSFDEKGRFIAIHNLATGAVNCAVTSPRMILESSIPDNASTVIISHNHPAGNTFYSKADSEFTDRSAALLKLSGIDLKSHTVVSGFRVKVHKPDQKQVEIHTKSIIEGKKEFKGFK